MLGRATFQPGWRWSIYVDDSFGNGTCPGSCQQNPAEPVSGTFTDVIIGGTGIFEGATGILTGSVKATKGQSQVKLSGVVVLAA
jgi:hypothetical protein